MFDISKKAGAVLLSLLALLAAGTRVKALSLTQEMVDSITTAYIYEEDNRDEIWFEAENRITDSEIGFSCKSLSFSKTFGLVRYDEETGEFEDPYSLKQSRLYSYSIAYGDGKVQGLMRLDVDGVSGKVKGLSYAPFGKNVQNDMRDSVLFVTGDPADKDDTLIYCTYKGSGIYPLCIDTRGDEPEKYPESYRARINSAPVSKSFFKKRPLPDSRHTGTDITLTPVRFSPKSKPSYNLLNMRGQALTCVNGKYGTGDKDLSSSQKFFIRRASNGLYTISPYDTPKKCLSSGGSRYFDITAVNYGRKAYIITDCKGRALKGSSSGVLTASSSFGYSYCLWDMEAVYDIMVRK